MDMDLGDDLMKKLPTPNQFQLINYSDYDFTYWYCLLNIPEKYLKLNEVFFKLKNMCLFQIYKSKYIFIVYLLYDWMQSWEKMDSHFRQ